MFLSGSIHKADLSTLQQAAAARAAALEHGLRFTPDDEEALGLALEHQRFLALAQKLETAVCERPVFLSLEDVERSIEALLPVHRAKGRSTNRTAFRELDALLHQLQDLAANLTHEEY